MSKPSRFQPGKPSHFSAPEQVSKQHQLHPAREPKIATVPQKPKLPIAPPVYRPSQRQSAQPKMPNQTAPKLPVAPPVYSPQPVPLVLQKKAAQAPVTEVTNKRGAMSARVSAPTQAGKERHQITAGASSQQSGSIKRHTGVVQGRMAPHSVSRYQSRPSSTQGVVQPAFSIGKSPWDIRADKLRQEGYTEREIERTIAYEKRQEQRKKREKELGKRGQATKVASASTGVPSGYKSLSDFNADENKYQRFPGLYKRGVDETNIYVKLVKLDTGKEVPFLWWANPLHTINNFVYLGSSAQDIMDCNTVKSSSGHTWHHTGYPHSESYGTMQLVPTAEHAILKHYGGNYLAYKEEG